jgi:hypothetical protein
MNIKDVIQKTQDLLKEEKKNRTESYINETIERLQNPNSANEWRIVEIDIEPYYSIYKRVADAIYVLEIKESYCSCEVVHYISGRTEIKFTFRPAFGEVNVKEIISISDDDPKTNELRDRIYSAINQMLENKNKEKIQ